MVRIWVSLAETLSRTCGLKGLSHTCCVQGYLPILKEKSDQFVVINKTNSQGKWSPVCIIMPTLPSDEITNYFIIHAKYMGASYNVFHYIPADIESSIFSMYVNFDSYKLSASIHDVQVSRLFTTS